MRRRPRRLKEFRPLNQEDFYDMTPPPDRWRQAVVKVVSRTRAYRFYRASMLLSAGTIVVLGSYAAFVGLYFGYDVVGETLVNLPTGTPIEFPSPEYFPIYAKPVTWLYVAVIGFWFSFLEVYKARLGRIPTGAFSIVKVFAFLIAAISAYEIFYNFTVWGSLMTYQAITGTLNPDKIFNPYPNPQTPWNLVFATKFFSSIFVVSLYSFFFIQRMERERREFLSA